MPKPKKTSGNKPPLSPTALRAFMGKKLGGFDPNKHDDRDRAQDLVYDAMEASTLEQRVRLARQALELDPENVDALLMQEEVLDLDDAERVDALRGIVATGEKRLGKKAFKELVPHFWGFHETRPYMRARARLASVLSMAGRLDEAAAEYTAMLALNEGDNQGVRYELLPMLLALGKMDEARALMVRFKHECDWSVVFAWSQVLEQLLSKNDAGAKQALKAARKQNAHMEAYLKGTRKLPKTPPFSYSLGSKEEAQCFAEVLLVAWKAHPEALAWLSKQSA
jgi:tetratricopeptide (TPR) repeat protein